LAPSIPAENPARCAASRPPHPLAGQNRRAHRHFHFLPEQGRSPLDRFACTATPYG
jgi:hypothetical protein